MTLLLSVKVFLEQIKHNKYFRLYFLGEHNHYSNIHSYKTYAKLFLAIYSI